MVWFEASGFYYTSGARPCLGLFLGSPVVTLCCEDPAALGSMMLQIIGGVDVQMEQVISLILSLDSYMVGPPDERW